MSNWVIKTGQVAELLSVPMHRIAYRIRSGQVAPNGRTEDGRYLWSFGEVCKLAEILDVHRPLKSEFKAKMKEAVGAW